MALKDYSPITVKEYAPVIVRYGVSFLFLWFGISQLLFPSDFLGWLPFWAHHHSGQMHGMDGMMHNFMHSSNVTDYNLVLVNGIFETTFGLLLLLGLSTRLTALILAIHMLHITIIVGYNDVGVRDFVLTLAAVSVFLNGTDRFCMDKKIDKKKLRWLYFLDKFS